MRDYIVEVAPVFSCLATCQSIAAVQGGAEMLDALSKMASANPETFEVLAEIVMSKIEWAQDVMDANGISQPMCNVVPIHPGAAAD